MYSIQRGIVRNAYAPADELTASSPRCRRLIPCMQLLEPKRGLAA